MQVPESLQDYAFIEIKNRIRTGEYPGGTRLVAKKIADSLGISSTPVVAAINRLEVQGLVTQIPNCGATVRTFSPADIREHCETRLMIESYAARHLMGCDEKYPEVFAEFASVAEQLRSADPHHMDQVSALEEQFHTLFVRLAGNTQLERVYTFNWGIGIAFFAYTDHNLLPEKLQVSLEEHYEMLQAIREHDEARLCSLVDNHLRFILKLFSEEN